MTPKLVRKPDIKLLLACACLVQVVIVCIALLCHVVFARGSSQQFNLVSAAALLILLVVSAIVRYYSLYVTAWSLAHKRRLNQRIYSEGLFINGIFDTLQAVIIWQLVATSQISNALSLLFIPWLAFWVLFAGIVTTSISRLLTRKGVVS